MQISNETVYRSEDIEAVFATLLHVAHNRLTIRRNEQLQCYQGQPNRYVPPAPTLRPLPDKLRIGYYARPKDGVTKRGRPAPYVSPGRSRYGWRTDEGQRIGIVRSQHLPLNAMEVIARAAADDEQRVLPEEVMRDLIRALCRYVASPSILEKEDFAVILEKHQVRYATKLSAAAKAARKRSQEINSQRTLDNARRNVGWKRGAVASLEKRLDEARLELEKAEERYARLRAEQDGRMSCLN
jgi:hypothetical protein